MSPDPSQRTAWKLSAPLGPEWQDRTSYTYQWADERVRLTITRLAPKDLRDPTLAGMIERREKKFATDPGDKTLLKRFFDINQHEAAELGVLTTLGEGRFVSFNLLVRDAGGVYDCVMTGPEKFRSAMETSWRAFVDGARFA